jgi:ubiquinone/menaquinone biosynthesis C-methylase UbiE
MYHPQVQSDLVSSSEPRRVQVDEFSPFQPSSRFSPALLPTLSLQAISDVLHHTLMPAPRRTIQERRGPYRSIGGEEPIGTRPLFVQHYYQDALMGGLLSDVVDFARCEQVLDVGCRTGEWICSLAQRYPQASFIGVDRNEYSIGQARAQSNQLSNALFLLKDVQGIVQALQGTRRFDLIHLSFRVGDLLVRDLLLLVEALVKLCKPGGLLVWSETELPLTNSPACERFNVLAAQTMQIYGSAPGPGNTIGIVPLMGYWLRRLKCTVVQDNARLIDVSNDVDAGGNFRRHFQVFSRQMKWPVLRSGLIWEAAYDKLCNEVERDMEQQKFCAVCWLRSVIVRYKK